MIGNGAAGALVVASMLREATRRATPLELAWIGDGDRGRGVAYSTPHPWHRLNVPAPGMTLGEADVDFPGWLTAHGIDDDPFAPRHAFGTYVIETVESARAAAGPGVRLTEYRDRAVHAARDDSDNGGLRFGLRNGTTVAADAAVVALGPFPSPALPGAGEEVADHPRVISDPWDGRVEQITGDPTVLLVGTGLTMVDVALTIGRCAPAARMIAVSRTGMLPRDHLPDEGRSTTPAVRPRAGLELDEVVAGIERAIDGNGGRWREVVDGLRAVTPDLWQSLPRVEQRRFLAEQARRWETHRHRMAPSVAAELASLCRDGRLSLHADGVSDVGLAGSRPTATLGDTGEEVAVDWVVSCTGAQDDVTAVDDPLVASLLDGGLARPHPLGLGFDTAAHGALDTGAPRLFGVGTLRRGELYETTAIPEIREQAEDLARHLLSESRPSQPPAA